VNNIGASKLSCAKSVGRGAALFLTCAGGSYDSARGRVRRRWGGDLPIPLAHGLVRCWSGKLRVGCVGYETNAEPAARGMGSPHGCGTAPTGPMRDGCAGQVPQRTMGMFKIGYVQNLLAYLGYSPAVKFRNVTEKRSSPTGGMLCSQSRREGPRSR
jgi:hypothetical protein